MKADKDEDHVFINNLLKMVHCLGCDVYNNNIKIDFLHKVEIFEQYRQSVMNSKNVEVYGSVIQKTFRD